MNQAVGASSGAFPPRCCESSQFCERLSAFGKIGQIGQGAIEESFFIELVSISRFAVNLQLFLSRPKAKFAYRVKRGHQVGSNLAC